MDYDLRLKYCNSQETIHLTFPPPGPYPLELKFDTKMQDFERVLDKLQIKEE